MIALTVTYRINAVDFRAICNGAIRELDLGGAATDVIRAFYSSAPTPGKDLSSNPLESCSSAALRAA